MPWAKGPEKPISNLEKIINAYEFDIESNEDSYEVNNISTEFKMLRDDLELFDKRDVSQALAKKDKIDFRKNFASSGEKGFAVEDWENEIMSWREVYESGDLDTMMSEENIKKLEEIVEKAKAVSSKNGITWIYRYLIGSEEIIKKAGELSGKEDLFAVPVNLQFDGADHYYESETEEYKNHLVMDVAGDGFRCVSKKIFYGRYLELANELTGQEWSEKMTEINDIFYKIRGIDNGFSVALARAEVEKNPEINKDAPKEYKVNLYIASDAVALILLPSGELLSWNARFGQKQEHSSTPLGKVPSDPKLLTRESETGKALDLSPVNLRLPEGTEIILASDGLNALDSILKIKGEKKKMITDPELLKLPKLSEYLEDFFNNPKGSLFEAIKNYYYFYLEKYVEGIIKPQEGEKVNPNKPLENAFVNLEDFTMKVIKLLGIQKIKLGEEEAE